MPLSVTRALDRSFNTLIKFFPTYSLLFLLVLFVKIVLFSIVCTTYFFNQSVSFFSNGKTIQAIIDLFSSYDYKIVWSLLYLLFFYTAVLIINGRSQVIDAQRAAGWANFFIMQLWGSYLLLNLFLYSLLSTVLLIGLLIYFILLQYGIEIIPLEWLRCIEWLSQQKLIGWYTFFTPVLLFIQARFFLIPYLMLQTSIPIIHIIKKSFSKTYGYVWFIIRTMIAGLLMVGVFNVIMYALSLYLQHLSSLWSYKIGFYLFFNALQTTFFCAMSMLFVAYASEEILQKEDYTRL